MTLFWESPIVQLFHGDARRLPLPLGSGPLEPPERLEPTEAENVRLAGLQEPRSLQ